MSVVLALSSVGGGALSAFATTISNDSASQQGTEPNAVPGHLAAVVSVGAQIYQQREAEEAARAAAEEQARQEAAARAAEQRAAQERAARAAAQRAYEAEQAAAQAAAQSVTETTEPAAEGADASQAPVQIALADTVDGTGNQDATGPTTEPQATPDELEGHVVSGLNPENTTINLFNYSATGVDANTTSDIVGTTGGASPADNYNTWLNNPDSINYGHMLTFGDGMRHLGYWNQGIVESYGDIATERPGMQGIVSPWLSEEGFPSINAGTYYMDADGNVYLTQGEAPEGANPIDTTLGPSIDNPAVVGGYDSNPTLYSEAWHHVGPAPWAPDRNYDEMVYFNAGYRWAMSGNGTMTNPLFNPVDGQNITDAVLIRVQQPGLPSVSNGSGQPSTNNGEGGTYNMTADQLSLRYLFDPSVTHNGKQSYTDVTGLFQIDNEGYFYYNMRKNFAEFVADKQGNSDGHFVLYDAPGGVRTDGENSVGSFFPFNKATEVFNVEDGKLVNQLRADNNYGTGNTGPLADHHLGMTVETQFRQPIDGKVAGKDMNFEFLGDDDVWVFVDDVLVLDLGGIHSEIYGTINFATGEVNLGTAFNSNGEIYQTDANGNIIYDADGNPTYITEPVIKTTIRHMFEKAGLADSTQWNGDTFASSTSHTLKMFYLERGNYDSSLMMRFNLQPALYQQIKKVDQNGKPLQNAEFELYQVDTPAGVTLGNVADVQLDDVQPVGAPLAKLVTDANGEARFMSTVLSIDGQLQPFNFSDRYNADTNAGLLYILRETKAPDGYKPLPSDLLLRFDPTNTMLAVNNRYQTGSYASFNSYVNGITGSVYYGQIGEDGGLVTRIPGTDPVPANVQENGLVVAVPMLKKAGDASGLTWLPLIGDNLTGFTTLGNTNNLDLTNPALFRLVMRGLTLGAALQQAALHADGTGEGWHLSWDDEYQRLTGTLRDLPGRADRYMHVNPNGDMRMFYGIITQEALARALGVSEDEVAAMTGDERYSRLGDVALDAIKRGGFTGTEFKNLVNNAIGVGSSTSPYDQRGYTPLDAREFVRNFRSVLYIPNEQRQLRVMKIDQNGTPVNGVQFALYDSEAKAAAGGSDYAASGHTATIDGRDGMLIFEPHQSHDTGSGDALPGYADMAWPFSGFSQEHAATYFLKEISAPAGYELNPTIIPVKVGVYSIYADAGSADDDVSVMAGVGKLTQTMIKYASNGEVNITLRDITAFAQKQPSGAFTLKGWVDDTLQGTDGEPVVRQMNLHYGKNAVVDYGLSDVDGGANYEPFFVTDEGFLRTRVQQNLHAHDDPTDPDYSDANADNLGDLDITGLFSLINTVVVTDRSRVVVDDGELMIRKAVAGEGLVEADYLKPYHFKVEFLDEQGNALAASYPFYGTDRSGSLRSGDVLLLHHDEAVVIQGLPIGSRYVVTELDANEGGFFCTITDENGVTIEASVAQGVVKSAQQQMLASFLNTRTDPQLGNLLIRKTVTGEGLTAEALQRSFNFKVELFDAAGNVLTGRYAVSNIDGVEYIESGDVLPLRHGQTALILYLPAGSYYLVTELDANQDGFTVAPSATQGGPTSIIRDGQTAEVSFVNTFAKPDEPDNPDNPDNPDAPDTPDNPDVPDNPDEPDTPGVPDEPTAPENPRVPVELTPVSHEIPSSSVPKTADDGMAGLLLASALAAVAFAGLFALRRTRLES